MFSTKSGDLHFLWRIFLNVPNLPDFPGQSTLTNYHTSGSQHIPVDTGQTQRTYYPVASTNTVLDLLRKKRIKTGYIHTLMFMYTIYNSVHFHRSPIWDHDDSPKEIMDKILGDTLDRHSFFSLCPDCERRSRSCTACKRRNFPGSLHSCKQLSN